MLDNNMLENNMLEDNMLENSGGRECFQGHYVKEQWG